MRGAGGVALVVGRHVVGVTEPTTRTEGKNSTPSVLGQGYMGSIWTAELKKTTLYFGTFFIDSVYVFPHIVVPFAEKISHEKGRNQGTHTAQLFQVKPARSAGFPYSSSRYLIPAIPGRSCLLLKRLT